MEQYQQEHNVPAIEIAATLAHLLQGDTPLLLTHKPQKQAKNNRKERSDSRDRSRSGERDRGPKGKGGDRNQTIRRREPQESFERKPRKEERSDERDHPRSDDKPRKDKPVSRRLPPPSQEMERFRIEVGAEHGVQTANIVGAIANEAGLEGKYIERVTIHETHSTVDLPEGMPRDIFKALKKTWVSGQQLKIHKDESAAPARKKDKPRDKLKLKKKDKAER